MDQYCELAVRRRLDEGFSDAKVFEAEWQSDGDGAGHWSVVKIDDARRLARERRLSERFQDAPSFTNVAAASFDPGSPPEHGPGCILYTHAKSYYPGEIRSLTDWFRQALAGDGASEGGARELLEQTLGVLRTQLHRGDADRPGAGGTQLSFYLERWLPAATVYCRQVELRGRSGLRLFEADHTPERQVELGTDDDDDQDRIGRRVAFEAEALYLDDRKVFVSEPERACFEIEGLEPGKVGEILGDRDPRAIDAVRIEGEVRQTRRRAYGERLSALGLDESAESFELGSFRFRNPLLGLRDRADSWSLRRPRPLYSYGHGDLHGGNVLCVGVGTNLAIIDHAMAGEDHPCYADAARLIGSLWRTAIAPALADEEIAAAIDQAFRRPEVAARGKVGVAARLMKAAFEAAIHFGPRVDQAPRELWVELHHFAWIGLKWPGEPSCHLAMVLLAAVAVEQVAAEAEALATQTALRSLVAPVREAPQVLAHVPAALSAADDAMARLDPEGRWALREELLRFAGKQLRELTADDSSDGGILGRMLDKALTGAWSEIESNDAASLRLSGAAGLGSRDRVVLVDVLLFAFLFGGREEVYDLILDLAMDGDRAVEAEAAMALGWLLSSQAVWDRLEADPALKRRTRHRLDRRELFDQIAWANRERFEYWDTALEFPELPLPVEPTSLGRVLWLRPFEPGTDLTTAERAAAPPRLLDLLAACQILGEGQKLAFGRSLPNLSDWQRRECLNTLREEARKWRSFDASRANQAGRMVNLACFIRNIRTVEQQRKLGQRLATFQRSYAELVADGGLRHLAQARETRAAAAAANARGDLEAAAMLARQAIERYETSASAIELSDDDLFDWGHLLGVLAGSTDDPDAERDYREQAIVRYRAAVAVKPDKHEALYNWGGQLIQLASLSVGEPKSQLLNEAKSVLTRYATAINRPLSQVYNYACLLALNQEHAEALECLEACLEAGTIAVDHVRKDPDWQELRSTAELGAVLDRYGAARDA